MPFPKEAEPARQEFSSFSPLVDAAPTMPLPLGKSKKEHVPPGSQAAVPQGPSATMPARPRRGRSAEAPAAAPASGAPSRSLSQPLPVPIATPFARQLASNGSQAAGTDVTVKQSESGSVLASDEDVVIFEQLRYQLVLWLRVEGVRSGIELNNQGAFQLIEALRHQEGVDTARLQVVSTLLNMCDQIVTSGRANLFDYKQAMMFYLMHTRRSQ